MTTAIAHWAPANQERAEEILALYPDRRSAVMPLMYVASLEHRYASESAMEEVAELVGITSAQVQSVVSFYTMFQRAPIGRYLVSVCTSISCHLMDGEAVLETATEAARAVNGDDDPLVTVERAECIGACGGAPAIQVNYETVEGLSPEHTRDLIQWLASSRPEVVLADEIQQLFGGRRAFDWGPKESEGAIAPIPAYGPFGSAKEGR